MWLLVAKKPMPDSKVWPGRRWLAAVDAAAWPLLWVLVSRQAPEPVGLVGPFVAAVAALCAIRRLQRAMWVNHRYRFTTWRWSKVAVAVVLLATVLKLTLPG